ncbi:unnamed protein product [Bursaphelenchus xylophilus]|uniref:(pine wood nematode) hypothetical protein n=1 Tax=Bursaphelenchus xylophilus TaxID=6326 RepID=A0A1I7SC77_BURXY|nr:unnamed protein product [Bursaphelenchus xylophilus]CAG9094606.1 unnamed protein product [Bursaphelenchus xylophilus]
MVLREIYPEICFVLTAVSVGLCVLVIFLSRRVLKAYRHSDYAWIMAFNAGVDIFYSLTHGVVVPSAVATSTSVYLTIENPYLHNISTSAAQIAAFFQWIDALCSAPCNTVHFYYRYRLLCKGDKWSRQRYLAAYGLVLAVIFFDSSLFYASTNPESESSRRELVAVNGDGYSVPPHVFLSLNNPVFMLCMFVSQLMFVVEYGVMIFCGQRIIRQAKKSTSAAKSTQQAQKHLIAVMVLQAVYPLILYFVPFMYVMIMLSMGVNFQDSSYVAGVSVQLLSPLNSISVLTLIPAYRRVLTKTSPSNSGTFFVSASRGSLGRKGSMV